MKEKSVTRKTNKSGWQYCNEFTDSQRRRWIHDLLLARLPALIININSQSGEDEKELLAIDLYGSQRVQRMMSDKRNAGMFSLDER